LARHLLLLLAASLNLRLVDLCRCRRLLERQLHHTETLLTLDHPLAAKMLAVKARLHLKLGDEPACEALQQRVLGMRQLALGMHHEDTHRSAMDVYSRRRAAAVRSLCHASLVSMAGSLLICLQMLQCAASRPDGMHGFQLSKSLQGMFELVYLDLIMVSQRGVWQQAGEYFACFPCCQSHCYCAVA